MSSMLSSFQKNDDASSAPGDGEKNEGQKFPDVLPILPLRGVVVYPNTAVPLTVGQARSIRLVDDVVGGDKLVGLVAALNPEQETPDRMSCIRSARSRPYIAYCARPMVRSVCWCKGWSASVLANSSRKNHI